MDIIIHGEIKVEVPSGSSKKEKGNKHARKSTENDCKTREIEIKRLEQLSNTRKDHLKVYINNFSDKATNNLVLKRHKVLILSRNTRTIFFIFYTVSETNRQNKIMMVIWNQFGPQNDRYL